jgi:hypothetical protein
VKWVPCVLWGFNVHLGLQDGLGDRGGACYRS